MNYTLFSELEAGTLCPGETESEQVFMERLLSAVFSEESEEMRGRINDKLAPRFTGCSAEEKSLTVSFTADEWMLNPNGTLHGGLLNTTIDIVMSVLSRYLAKKRVMVTVQLSTNFLRPIQRGETFLVHAAADHAGRRSVVLHAQVTAAGSTKPAATATAVFM